MRTRLQDRTAREQAASNFKLNQDLTLLVLSLTNFRTVATSSCVCKSWKASIGAAPAEFWRTVWHKSNKAKHVTLQLFEEAHMRGMDWPLLAAPVPCGILCGPYTAKYLNLAEDGRTAKVLLNKVPNLQGFGQDVSFLRMLAPIIDRPMFGNRFWPDVFQATYPFILQWDSTLSKLTPDSLTRQLRAMHSRTGDSFTYYASKLSMRRSQFKQLAHECVDDPIRASRYPSGVWFHKISGRSKRCIFKQVSEWAHNFDLSEGHTFMADSCVLGHPTSEDEAVVLAQNCLVAVHKLLRYVKPQTLIRIHMSSMHDNWSTGGTQMVLLAGMSRSGYCVGLVVSTPVDEGLHSDGYSEDSDDSGEDSDGYNQDRDANCYDSDGWSELSAGDSEIINGQGEDSDGRSEDSG